MKKMPRRDFLKSTLIGAGAGVVTATTALHTAQAKPVNQKKSTQWDVVVVGAGFAGMCCALEAAEKGAKVVLLEKMGRPDGATVYSSGQYPIEKDSHEDRIVQVLIEELLNTQKVDVQWAVFSEHPKMKLLLELILSNPTREIESHLYASQLEMSDRSFLRFITQQTGMNFGAWRQNVLFTYALNELLNGAQVNELSDQLGYSVPSAFIAAFKKNLGVTPGSIAMSTNSRKNS